jgi:hypothetical protein
MCLLLLKPVLAKASLIEHSLDQTQIELLPVSAPFRRCYQNPACRNGSTFTSPPLVLAVVQRLLGERARLKSMHGVIGLPGCEEQGWFVRVSLKSSRNNFVFTECVSQVPEFI